MTFLTPPLTSRAYAYIKLPISFFPLYFVLFNGCVTFLNGDLHDKKFVRQEEKKKKKIASVNF